MYKRLVVLLLLPVVSLKAADKASDRGSFYKNPWGPDDPQNRAKSGFADWVFDLYNPPTQDPPVTPFFIDKQRGAWAVNVEADIQGQPGYDAAWASFTGDGQLDSDQTYEATVLFTPPGAYSTSGTPTEGVDLFALSPTVPSKYDNFGHQVMGIYVGPTSTGISVYFGLHNTLSDENPTLWKTLPIKFTGTAKHPEVIKIIYKQLAQANWSVRLDTARGSIVLTSGEYGATWNTTTGVDGVRFFTSQGGTNPVGPLAWEEMSVK
jgi:hypothetical protein